MSQQAFGMDTLDAMAAIQARLAKLEMENAQLIAALGGTRRESYESGEQYKLLIEAMPQLVWLADAQGNLLFCNRFFREYSGLTQEECKRITVVHPDDLPAATARWQEAVSKGEAYEIEYRLRRAADRTYRWVSVSLVPVRDGAGEVSHWIGTAIDIDDKRRAEAELRKSEEQLRLAHAAAHAGSWTLNRETGEFTWSPECFDLLGLEASSGQRLFESGLASVLPEDRETLKKAFQSPGLEGVSREFRILKNNEIRWLLMLGRTVKTHDGALVLAGVIVDITSQKVAQEALARQAAQLARSNADLQHFSSIASHDLQEPLRNIAIYSELLVHKHGLSLSEDVRQLLGFILAGAKRGQVLTQALLSYARAVDSNNISLAPIGLEDSLNIAISNLKSKIAEAGATVTHDALPAVMADEIQVVQLFQNLIENAIKYRSEQPPVIHVAATHRDEGPADQWVISVRDNGVGVPQTHWHKIFEPFQRLHGQKVSGSGIGLATCKRIIERHGGKIWVESEKGSGSVFYFTLNAANSGSQSV